MTSASSMSVFVEYVNICNLAKGDGNARSDCNALSCASKAPRVLTGFLATTAHPPVCSLYLCGRNGRKSRTKYCAWQSYEYEVGFSEVPRFVNVGKSLRSRLSCGGHKRWELYCLSYESSGASDDVTVETLWEIDVDIGSSEVARSVIGLVLGYVTRLIVDLAILTEGKEETELPEYVLGTVRLNRLEPDSVVLYEV